MRRGFSPAGLVVLGAMTVLAVVSWPGAEAASKDTELILAELRTLQSQIAEISRVQAELQTVVQRLANSVSEEQGSLRRSLVDAQTTIDTMQEHILVVSAKVDETNARLRNVGQELASLRQAQPIIIPPTAPEATATVPAPSGGAQPPAPPAPPSSAAPPAPSPAPAPVVAGIPDAGDLYKQAYADYTQQRYPLAISGFKEILTRYADSELADNAQYWIGECLLAQRKYKEALEAFDALISLYPKSNKLDYATYKKAIALEAMGSRADAIRQLELVIEKFPKTDVARTAREKLNAMR